MRLLRRGNSSSGARTPADARRQQCRRRKQNACATKLLLAAISLLAAPGILPAQSTRSANISLRKRLHINTLITEPDTIEIDWAGVYSFSSTNFQMPAAIKFTPQGHHVIWGRTEYSAAFDSLTNTQIAGGRETQFSQSVTATATSVLHDGEKLDIALAPQATFFLRDESGQRFGVVAIARYDSGHNSMGTTFSWSAATHSSPTNPAGTFDVGFGYGRNLSGSPLAEKFTPHFNLVWERSTGQTSFVSLFEGVEYQMTQRVAFDLSGQHLGGSGQPRDHQLVFGMTVNLGKLQ